MTDAPFLIADIGGTNARFALSKAAHPFFSSISTLQCADHASVADAIDAYLDTQGISSVSGMCFAVAGKIQEQRMNFLNNAWSLDAAQLKHRYRCDKIWLLNDFEAISYSLAELTSTDLQVIGQAPFDLTDKPQWNLAVLGPGSGLGVGGLRRTQALGAADIPTATEGGHTGFAPDSELQDQVLRVLRKKYSRVSVERILSGPGLVNLYEALCDIYAQDNPGLSPADITAAAEQKSDTLCTQVMDLFFRVLGQVAGDVVLGQGAYDGLFIAGGIVQRFPAMLQQSEFRAGFENKGRYTEFMQSIPTMLVTHNNPGLLGASIYARSYLTD